MSECKLSIYDAIEFHGDLDKPIPADVPFATLPTREAFDVLNKDCGMPYPPVPEGRGCVFNVEDRTLMTRYMGRLVESKDGLRIKPIWQMTRDRMVLSVEVSDVDFMGNSITIERIKETMPPVFESLVCDIDYDAIEAALLEARESGEATVATVATGQLAKPGTNGRLELKFGGGQTAGTLREDGSMDYRERSDMQSVAEGDVLGRKYSMEPGEPGVDLYGSVLPPHPVREVHVTTSQAVEVREVRDGVIEYIALKGGIARFRNNLLDVVDLMEIKGDVDYSTGNVRAKSGAVHIKGDIKSGFLVECAEDVIVDGLVEDADIVAGGLVVAGGVIMTGKHTIKAEGDVSAHFFRNAVIEAGGNVNSDQEIANCTVKAGGSVIMHGGIISGGHIICHDSIEAGIIGNKTCGRTIVEIQGIEVDKSVYVQEKEKLQKRLQELNTLVGVEFDNSSLDSAPEEDRLILAELLRVRNELEAEIMDVSEIRKQEIRAAQNKLYSKRVRATQKMYCGVEVIIGSGHLVTEKNYESPTYRLDPESHELVMV